MMVVTRMPKSPSFKDVLRGVIANRCYGLLLNEAGYPLWNKKLRGFLERWLNNQDDSARLEKIAASAERRGMSREECFTRIATSAAVALFAGDPLSLRTRSPEAWRSKSTDYRNLVRCARSLAKYYLRLSKNSPRHFVAMLERRSQFYEQEAKDLRRFSDNALARASTAARQSRGKKFSQEHLLFMGLLAARMRRDFGKPHNEAVAAIANIAFPVIRARNGRPVTVTDEDVQKAYTNGHIGAGGFSFYVQELCDEERSILQGMLSIGDGEGAGKPQLLGGDDHPQLDLVALQEIIGKLDRK
jgi:hypothetical protein